MNRFGVYKVKCPTPNTNGKIMLFELIELIRYKGGRAECFREIYESDVHTHKHKHTQTHKHTQCDTACNTHMHPTSLIIQPQIRQINQIHKSTPLQNHDHVFRACASLQQPWKNSFAGCESVVFLLSQSEMSLH